MGCLAANVTSGGGYGWAILDSSMVEEESPHQYKTEKQGAEGTQ